MNKQKKNILLRFLRGALPTFKDVSKFIKLTVIFLIGLTAFFIFDYTSTANAQTKVLDNTTDGIVRKVSMWAAGCKPFITNPALASANSTTAGIGNSDYTACQQQVAAIQQAGEATSSGSSNVSMAPEFDYGPTGRVINASAMLQASDVAQPGLTMEYYASKIKGTTYAADNPTGGRSVLAPVFQLNQFAVNLAYGLVVIVLLVSSLSILLGSLTGGEEKVSVVQLLINAGVTLVMITLFYEISAIIYDLTVNYGNALVASALSPYVNSQIVLERLEPGGDLSIMAVLNTFEFIGVSDSLLAVTKSIGSGLYPAIAQSAISFGTTLGGSGQDQAGVLSFITGHSVAPFFGFIGGTASVFLSSVASSFLGSTEFFEAIISWGLFIVNLKIFINLLTAFITFTIYVGFGPLLMLGGISGGFEKISAPFKNLVGYGLVFPLTFFFILIASISANMFVRKDIQEAGVTKSELCRYNTSDPANTQNSVINRSGLDETLARLFQGNPEYEDPTEFRYANYIGQRIFDTTPTRTYTENGKEVRDCRASLFPTPWTFVPAPFGSLGQRNLQVQTIDSLVRTFLGIVFIILASRAPDILKEVLEIKEMGSLSGIQKPFASGLQSFFGVGATALSIGLPIVTKAGGAGLKFAGNRLDFGKFLQRFSTSQIQRIPGALGARLGDLRQIAEDNRNKRTKGSLLSLTEAFGELSKQGLSSERRNLANEAGTRVTTQLMANGVNRSDAVIQGYQEAARVAEGLNKQLSVTGQSLVTLNEGLQTASKSLGDFASQIQKLVALSFE